MAVYTKRVQAVFTDKQYDTLSQLSRERGRSVSELVRDAVERVYFEEAERERRLAAVARLAALNAPVADWPQMEEEIIRGALE
ncbi:MAG: ribbon-helix-helix protein, CopG family [Chloroflexota bacterium]